jgi:hypothetical protein
MGRMNCGVIRKAPEELLCETELVEGTVVLDGMGRSYCGVRRNGTEVLWCETEWDGGLLCETECDESTLE